jgi:hypothetical protein
MPYCSLLLPSESRLLLEPARHEKPRPEKFRHNSLVARIATNRDTTIAWKASPTRTPPPICTSAPFLKPRWSYDRGRREQIRNTRCGATRNAFDSTSERPIAVDLAHGYCGASASRKQVFESPRKIAQPKRAVINGGLLQKKIYKSFKQEP